MGRLGSKRIDTGVLEVHGWVRDGDGLTKTFTFPTFADAIAFMAAAAPKIDELNHHPEWSNVYNRVDVRLTSHDVKGITDRDVRLAGLLDELATPPSD